MVYERMPVWLKHGEQVESDDVHVSSEGPRSLNINWKMWRGSMLGYETGHARSKDI